MFSADVYRAITYDAQEAAHELGNDFVSSEHVLIAILDERTDPSVQLIDSLAVGGVECVILSAKEKVKRFGRMFGDNHLRTRLPQTELLVRKAEELANGSRAERVHLLLQMLAWRESGACEVLSECDVSLASFAEALKTSTSAALLSIPA
ncbi:MAG: hypothetical protein KDD64_13655 [Bdellovibrionales bacterium]|nr:hypothetical protein [Bdellovibrionales bacterium]